MSTLQEVNRVINVMKQPCHQMSPKSPIWLMNLSYQVDTYLYPDPCIARDCFMILRLTRFHFNALSCRIQRPNSLYKMALQDMLGGFSLQLSLGTFTLLNATGIFTSKHRHFFINIFIFYEVFNPETSCNNTSSSNKPKSYLPSLCVAVDVNFTS